jgi:aryl-alcohol dehydrogenase-like predicted oxidoreductase
MKTSDIVKLSSLGPRVGLGCMGMSEFYGARDDEQSLGALNVAFTLGYRHFDTADMYGHGHNEELLGRAIRAWNWRRDEVVIATKFGIRRPAGGGSLEIDSSPAHAMAACDASLKRLGVDHIDLYYLHRRNPLVPIEDTVLAMADLVRAGKVGRIGLSEVSEDTLRRACSVHPIAALQSEYSLWTRDVEAALLPATRELGVELVAYSPIGRGFLSGALSSEARPAGDLRALLPRFQGKNFEANQGLLAALRAVADEAGATMSRVALAWVLSRSDNIHVIPGSRRSEHLASNLASAELRLSSEQLRRLSDAFSPEKVHGARYPEQLLHTVNV